MTFEGSFTMIKPVETFPALPALAERLGVRPNTGTPSRVALTMMNGDSYDLFELINAVLDRVAALDIPSQITPDVPSA